VFTLRKQVDYPVSTAQGYFAEASADRTAATGDTFPASSRAWLAYLGSQPALGFSAANQFFTESQFESYRQLGFEIAERALEDGGCTPLDPRTPAPTRPAGRAPKRI
jgi:hypothetical protein